MTSKERLKIRLAIFKNNLKIKYNKMLIRINQLKMLFNILKTLIQIKLIPLRMRLVKIRFALFPIRMVFFMPGYITLGILAVIAMLINRDNIHQIMGLNTLMRNPEALTEDQKQYIEKWLDFSYHISFWFWIALIIIVI